MLGGHLERAPHRAMTVLTGVEVMEACPDRIEWQGDKPKVRAGKRPQPVRRRRRSACRPRKQLVKRWPSEMAINIYRAAVGPGWRSAMPPASIRSRAGRRPSQPAKEQLWLETGADVKSRLLCTCGAFCTACICGHTFRAESCRNPGRLDGACGL